MATLTTAGTNDPVLDPEETRGLENLLRGYGARVGISRHGHSLIREELDGARLFLSES